MWAVEWQNSRFHSPLFLYPHFRPIFENKHHRILVNYGHAFHSIQPKVLGKLSNRRIRILQGIKEAFDRRSLSKHFDQLCIDLIQFCFCLVMAAGKRCRLRLYSS